MPTYVVLNAMAITADHNQYMIYLDKCTILFLYGNGFYSCSQFSYALMGMFNSNDNLQLA